MDLYYPETVTDSDGNFEFKGVSPDIQVLIQAAEGSIPFGQGLLTKNATLWVDFFNGKLNLVNKDLKFDHPKSDSSEDPKIIEDSMRSNLKKYGNSHEISNDSRGI